VLTGWGVLFAGIFGSVSVANARDDAGAATVTALFAVLGLWLAWRWWRLGVAIGRRSVVFRDVARSRKFPREAVEAVAAVTRTTPLWRRILMGDWVMTHELVVYTTEGAPSRRVGMQFSSREAAAFFAGQVNAALTDSARSVP
jgi:hypothetical protein